MAPVQIDRSRVSRPTASTTGTQGPQRTPSTPARPAPAAPRPAARPTRPQDTFETSKTPPGVVLLGGRQVTPAQREAGRKAMLEGFTSLAQRVAAANPPLSREQVRTEADGLRSRFFDVGYKNPGDNIAGNGLYTAVTSMATAVQLLAEGKPDAVDRARVMLNLAPHDAAYANAPEVKQYMASKLGAKESLDQVNGSGSVNPGELAGLYRAWSAAGDLTAASYTPAQQAQLLIEQMDAITAYSASKKGWLSSNGFDTNLVRRAASFSTELRRVLDLDDSVRHSPPKDVQLKEVVQRAKSSVIDALPKNEEGAKVLDARREAAFTAGDKFADAVSALPGVLGSVGGFVTKEIGVALRVASGDMTVPEAFARTAVNAVDSFCKGRLPYVKVPGGSLLSQAFTGAINKMVTSLTPDLVAIWRNSKTNGATTEQIYESVERAVTKAMAEAFKEAVFSALTGAKDMHWRKGWSTEDAKEVHEALVGAADKWGIGLLVKEPLDAVLDLPKRYPVPK